jgi:hypothetical protein
MPWSAVTFFLHDEKVLIAKIRQVKKFDSFIKLCDAAGDSRPSFQDIQDVFPRIKASNLKSLNPLELINSLKNNPKKRKKQH